MAELHSVARMSSADKARLVFLARQSATYNQRLRDRALAAVQLMRDANTLHRAADAHFRPTMLAVSYAFGMGRKAYKSGGVKAATAAVKAGLLKALPTALASAYAAGGNAGLALLGRRARVAPRAAGAVLQATSALSRDEREGGTDSKGLPQGRASSFLRTLKPQVPGEPHETKPPFNLQFNATDENAIAWARMHVSQIADDISQTSKDAINEAIAQALEGDGLDSAYDTILAAVGDPARAEMIARTETMTAAAEGQRAGWDDAVEAGLLDADSRVEWIATSDACSEICEPMDGETRALDGEYDSGEEVPAHPNCLPGDCLVTPVGRVAASSERRFDGDLVVLHTASGHELSCTTNHPILTDRGWVGAGLLNVGNHVVSLRGCDRETQSDFNHQHVPFRIEDVARFSDDASVADRRVVPTSPHDFHGDGGGSEVAVIRTNRLLRDSRNSAFGEQIAHELLTSVQASESLDADGVGDALSIAADGPERGSMSRRDLPLPRFAGHVPPLQGLALALVTWCHSLKQENAADRGADSVAPMSDLIFGLAGEIETGNVVVSQRRVLAPLEKGLSVGASSDASPEQFSFDGLSRDAELARELMFIRASDIQLDKLVSVGRRQFSGHVFNLQTESQLYIGNGIFASNCRCTEGISA